jgi:hypothetical protein
MINVEKALWMNETSGGIVLSMIVTFAFKVELAAANASHVIRKYRKLLSSHTRN